MREGGTSWSKLGLVRGGGAPRDCGGRDVAPDPFYLRIHSTDDTFLVTDAFRLPTWGTGLAG